MPKAKKREPGHNTLCRYLQTQEEGNEDTEQKSEADVSLSELKGFLKSEL